MSSQDGGLGSLFRERLLPLGFWCQRIESGATGGGIPDTHWIRSCGMCGWLEFKKESAVGSVGLRPAQIAWLSRYTRSAGRAHVAIRLRHAGGPRKGPPADELWLLDARYAREIRRAGLTPGADWLVGRWSGGPRHWDWEEVAAALTR